MALSAKPSLRHAAAVLAGLSLAACASDFKDPGPIRWHAAGAAPRYDAHHPASQCVPYARKVSGVTIRGDAHTWWDKASGAYETSRHPSRGAVIVMRGYNSDTRGHVGVVRKILDDRQISIDHANWGNREEVQLDTPVMDVSNANDWSKVRVWNLKDGHFGGRVYDVEGFILPERRSAGGLFW